MLATARLVQQTSQSEAPKQSSLVRRHTITSMPVSAATLSIERSNTRQTDINNSINSNDKTTASVCQSPSKYSDSKAYVGSFTNPTNSRTSTPHRRASVQQKRTILNSNTNTNLIQLSKTDRVQMVNNNKPISSVGSTPVKVKNNFNNDFYRLCSDTFYYGSDHNLLNNQSMSNSSLNYQFQLLENQLSHKQQKSNETEILKETIQTNLTAHVNNLFDQWLLNSSSVATKPPLS